MNRYLTTFLITLGLTMILFPAEMQLAVAGGVSTAKVNAGQEAPNSSGGLKNANEEASDGEATSTPSKLSQAEKDQIWLHPGLNQSAGVAEETIWLGAFLFLYFAYHGIFELFLKVAEDIKTIETNT